MKTNNPLYFKGFLSDDTTDTYSLKLDLEDNELTIKLKDMKMYWGLKTQDKIDALRNFGKELTWIANLAESNAKDLPWLANMSETNSKVFDHNSKVCDDDDECECKCSGSCCSASTTPKMTQDRLANIINELESAKEEKVNIVDLDTGNVIKMNKTDVTFSRQ